MDKRFFSIIVLIALCMTVAAQSSVEAKKKEINRIKKNPSQYLYVEVVDSLEEVAVVKAQHFLADEIDEYVEEQKKLKKAAKVVAIDMKNIVTMPRGNNRFRAFAYIKKSNIMATDNAVVLNNANRTVQRQGEEKTTGTDKRQDTIDRLLALKRFSELEACLNLLKQEGRISKYGKQKTLGDLNPYVLIIYNRNGDIEALLSEGPQRVNLKNGKSDNVSNYKERGALGVLINNK